MVTKDPKNRIRQGAVREMALNAEKNASAIRIAANLLPHERICAVDLASTLGLNVMVVHELLAGQDGTLVDELSALDAKTWSAMAIPSTAVIVVNPNQTEERKQSSIMEEVAHLFLGQNPTLITSGRGPGVSRSFDASGERLAFWTGAAVLLPAEQLSLLVWRRKTIPDIAASFGVSVELVEFRLKILGLWTRVNRDASQ